MAGNAVVNNLASMHTYQYNREISVGNVTATFK
jgi:hypothetical protein